MSLGGLFGAKRLIHDRERMNTANDVVIDQGCAPLPSRENLLTMDQKHSSQDIFISISGLIGAGKTTLATKLAEKMNLPCFFEPVIDNEYLADFYKDPARYSFPLQVRELNSIPFLCHNHLTRG